jgi:serine/threonine protein kinase
VSTPPISLSPGDRLGRYQIVALLGAGGMGEVYRAHDPELHRDVALKVLRRSSASADELARFGREARAAGGLNHPNIVVVYDVGVEAGVPYVVTELLEGETLRARLDRGPIPFLKAVDYGSQIAAALGAAHARSIWHRDVKPANVFITNDGRVKLLDFGIAKLGEKHVRANANDPTEEVSDRHSIFGTAGYMSPEQVLGHPADHRSDIFAFGAVLYEMFTRTRAFKRDSTVQTMTAVLQDDPPDPLSIKPDLPPMAVAIVRRCLEKNKEERFQSARDLAFDLHQLRETSTKSRPLPLPAIVRRRMLSRWMAMAALVLAALAAGWLLKPSAEPPVFEQLTFRRARISSARFLADDRAIVYSESREGNTLDLWRLDLGDSPPTRPLDYPAGADILASRAGEIALLVKRSFVMGERFVGTLATAPLGGGEPLERRENVEDADWDASGVDMVVVRSTGIGGGSWLEYPLDTRLYETGASIRSPRVSPDERHIAFIEDRVGSDEGGRVSVINIRSRAVTELTGGWKSIRGMAWSPDGGEIWFTAGDSRSNRVLRAVTLDKALRVLLSAPGSITLWDVAEDGRVLLSRDDERRSLVGMAPGDRTERDLSWLDDSGLADISDDGTQVLFKDRSGVYLRDIKSALPRYLGGADTYADDLSPDGSRILATNRDTTEVRIMPTGPGAEQKLPAHGIKSYSGARWFPDGQRILFAGRDASGNLRAYVQDLSGAAPRPITPERIWALVVSPNSEWAAAIGDVFDGVSLYPVSGEGPPQPVSGSVKGDRPVAFTRDGRWLWMFRRGEVPCQVIKVDLVTGERQIVKPLVPADVAGVYSITEFAITPDGGAYFYSYHRLLSQLYVVDGLR